MEKNLKIYVISLAICLICSFKLSAQEKLHYWGDSISYLQEQASMVINEAYKNLTTYPPGTVAGNERRLALFALDALFHDTRLDNGVAFMSYMDRAITYLSTDIRRNKPTGNEIRFYRFYNHGFIIQTPQAVIGIDLVRGGRADKPFIGEKLMRAIVELCDVLFITHAHGDHADLSVAKMFSEQGKTVVVPEEIWKESGLRLRVMRGTEMIRESVRLPEKNTTLLVQVYPGKQGNMLNNVYAITLPNGQTIMHTGDQDYSDELVAKISSETTVDVLLVQCWMMPMDKFVSGIKPTLIITGHENEMMHTIDHRESYWLTFRRMSGITIPYVVMAISESYLFSKL